MLKNKDQPDHALFAPMPNGAFRRFSGLTGKPLDFHPDRDPPGLFDLNGRLAFGQMPCGQARDAMPELWDKTAERQSQSTGLHPKEVAEGEGEGARNKSGRSGPEALLQLPYEDNDNGGFLPEISPDQEGAGGEGKKISRGRAVKIWTLLKSRLSPADLETAVKYLTAMIDESLSDEDDEGQGEGAGEARDEPPDFVGKPRPGGTMVGDQALAAFKSEYGLDRIGHCPPYGEPVPRNRFQKEAAKLALDARERSGDPHSLESSDPELFRMVSRIGRCY